MGDTVVNLFRLSLTRLDDMIRICENLVRVISARYERVDDVSFQDNAILKLFIDQIETSRSILFLLERNQLFGVNSLRRSCLEQFIYLNAVLADPETALMYQLNCIIEGQKEAYNLKPYKIGEIIVEEYSFEFDGEKCSIEKDKLKEYINLYKSNFPKNSTNHKWYNLDGKTSGIEKLVKKLKLDPVLMAEYASLSKDTHSVNGNLQVNQILKSQSYVKITNHMLINFAHSGCVELLCKSHNLISQHFELPSMNIDYGDTGEEDLAQFFIDAIESAKQASIDEESKKS